MCIFCQFLTLLLSCDVLMCPLLDDFLLIIVCSKYYMLHSMNLMDQHSLFLACFYCSYSYLVVQCFGSVAIGYNEKIYYF